MTNETLRSADDTPENLPGNPPDNLPDNPPDTLETSMQKVSRVVSLIALGLMVVGFADLLVSGAAMTIPGSPVLRLAALVRPYKAPISLVTMSAGILLLSLLPSVRVVLAVRLYLRRRHTVDTLAAVAVLVELLVSMWAGG